MLHTHEVTGSSPVVSTKRKPQPFGCGFFLLVKPAEGLEPISNAAVRGTAAPEGLPEGHLSFCEAKKQIESRSLHTQFSTGALSSVSPYSERSILPRSKKQIESLSLHAPVFFHRRSSRQTAPQRHHPSAQQKPDRFPFSSGISSSRFSPQGRQLLCGYFYVIS